MKIRKRIYPFLLPFLCFINPHTGIAQSYEEMMYDMSVNFYDVCAAAESHFAIHGTDKGSGYKEFMRWKTANESKYFPDGERSSADPLFAEHAFEAFLRNNGNQRGWFDNGWRDLGPYEANSITEGYNPGIGRVEAVYADPTNSQTLYLASRSGGFWRSFNEGITWENTTDFLVASGVNTFAVSPTNSDSILINVQNSRNHTSHGIYRSTNAGASWTITNFNPSNIPWSGLGNNGRVYKIVYHPLVSDVIFVGTSNGLYRSDDNLTTFTQLLNGSDITDIEFHPVDPDIIYVYDDSWSGPNGDVILRSTDMGLTFNQSTQISGNSSATGFIAVTPVAPNSVYFASSNGIWKSMDTGQTFTFVANPGQSCRGFIVSDVDSLAMLYGYVDLEATTNGGTSFSHVTFWANTTPDASYVHADLRAAESVNGVYYIGTDGYMCKSTDNGFSWTRLSDGTGVREFYAVGLSQSNWGYAMAGSQDNGTSVFRDFDWIEWNGGDGMEAIIQPLNEDWMVGSWQYGTRQRTKDAGQTRHGINTPQSGSSDADWQAPLLCDPLQQMRIYHFASDIYYSNTFGDNWQFLSSPGMGIIKKAAMAENNSNIMAIARNADLELSTDGGLTFNNIFFGLPTHSITDIAFDPNDDSTIVVTYNRHTNDNQKVYISHNLGNSWANITYNLGDMPVLSAVIDHSDSSYIYVGAEIGVFYKSMQGTSWNLYNTNFPNVNANDLEIHWGSNTLRAATYGRGLWDYTLVGRNDYPSILTTHITDPPTDLTPYEGVPQDVTAVISYDNVITSAYVTYSANSLALDNTIPMINTADSTWVTQTPLPNYPDNTDVYFKVFAVGSGSDTTETYRFMYNVKGTSSTADLFRDKLNLYPNPTAGEFTIDLSDIHSEVMIEIQETSGRRVYSQTHYNVTRVPLSKNLAAGTYFVTVTSGKESGTLTLTVK